MDKNKVYQHLNKFINIQSVSTDPKRFDQILEGVTFLEKKLHGLGFEVQILKKDQQPPLVLACKNVSDKAKTIAIYGHYDVQPEDPIDEWQSPPFVLTIKNGKLYSRGVADNKGHIIQNLAAIEELIRAKKLNNNIIFIIEGEEEIGSISFEDYVLRARDLLGEADVFYLTDAGMHAKNIPQIFYGLRGIIYFELKISIGERDLHSGIYGNKVLNPAQVLSDVFTKIKDIQTGRILIPHFYDRCRKISEQELLLLNKVIRSHEEERKIAGVYKIVTVDDIHPTLAAKIYPSFDIHGLLSGYIGQGEKTIIPKEAKAKFSFRLVEHQKPGEIEELVKDFTQKNLPVGVRHKLKTCSKSDYFYTKIDHPLVEKTAKILDSVFGRKTLFNRTGGSIPAAAILQRLFKKPVIITGFTLPDDNLHAPNENFDVEMFWKGIEALQKIYYGSE